MTALAVYVDTPPFPPPPPPAPPAPPPFVGAGITWQGWDGQVWDLQDYRGGVVLGQGDFEGLLDPPHERYTSTSPSRPGSRHRGGRDLERPVSFVVYVFSDRSSLEWLERDRAFKRTLDRRQPGVLTVHTPDNRQRSLVMRYERTEASLNGDPIGDGWAAYGLQFVADEQPYWQGETVPGVFDLGDESGAEDFHDDSRGYLYIAQASTIANATITNPGDVPGWPVWTVEGEAHDVVLGVGSDLLGVQLDTGPGDELQIDTRRQVSLLNGVRVRGILNPHEFAPIPARSTLPLNITATGTGRIRVQVVPLYERAW